MALSNVVPLTPDKVAERAPTLCAFFRGDAAEALRTLRLHLDSNLHRREMVAARAALGFDERVNNASKQQRLSDLAVYFNRTGWRNMYRWASTGFESLAYRYSSDSRPHLLFDVAFFQDTQCEEEFAARVRFFEPDPENGKVHEVSLYVNDEAVIQWIPEGDESVELWGIRPIESDSGAVCTFETRWFTNADGEVATWTNGSAQWWIATNFTRRMVAFQARRTP